VLGVKIVRAHELMMRGCVVLDVVITLVVLGARAPVDKKLSLIDAITNPIKTHFHCVGLALFDGVIGDSGGSGVVSFDWCGWLRMSEFFKCGSKDSGFLSVDEEATYFRFGGRYHDGFQFLADNVDDTVGSGGLCGGFMVISGLVTEVMVASNATASFR
jgi:hypothetical protein